MGIDPFLSRFFSNQITIFGALKEVQSVLNFKHQQEAKSPFRPVFDPHVDNPFSMTPKIAITMGDPAGIGPEVVIKALAQPGADLDCSPFVIGDSSVLRRTISQLGVHLRVDVIDGPDFRQQTGLLPVLEPPGSGETPYRMGAVDAWCGDISYQAVVLAAELNLSGAADAMVTGPISKAAWHAAGHRFDGHTGLLAELTQCEDYRMAFVSERLNVMLATTHIPLCRVCGELTETRIFKTLRLADGFCRDLGIADPRIAVSGVNPHAGESCIFGDEDERTIAPAVRRAAAEGMAVVGPLPADTVFLRAVQGEFDLVIAQYHDQGLIPIKLLAFETAVNVSVGLPIVRTSVDHGTAFDIAGRGIADHRNMQFAVDCAVRLADARKRRNRK